MSQMASNRRRRQSVRDQVWKAVRRLKRFTFNQICDETHQDTQRSRVNVTEYLAGLTVAGYLQRDPEMNYTLVKDNGVDTPHVRRDGSVLVQGKGREQVWTILPILKEFSAKDVAIHATTETVVVSEAAAKEYLRYLHRAGYLVASRPSRHEGGGVSRQPVRYRFLQSKYTGPKPPVVLKTREVYDDNTGKVVWSKGDAYE